MPVNIVWTFQAPRISWKLIIDTAYAVIKSSKTSIVSCVCWELFELPAESNSLKKQVQKHTFVRDVCLYTVCIIKICCCQWIIYILLLYSLCGVLVVPIVGLAFSAKVLEIYFGEEEGCSCVLVDLYFVAYTIWTLWTANMVENHKCELNIF